MKITYKIKLLHDGTYSVQRRNALSGKWVHRNKFATHAAAVNWAERHANY